MNIHPPPPPPPISVLATALCSRRIIGSHSVHNTPSPASPQESEKQPFQTIKFGRCPIKVEICLGMIVQLFLKNHRKTITSHGTLNFNGSAAFYEYFIPLLSHRIFYLQQQNKKIKNFKSAGSFTLDLYFQTFTALADDSCHQNDLCCVLKYKSMLLRNISCGIISQTR